MSVCYIYKQMDGKICIPLDNMTALVESTEGGMERCKPVRIEYAGPDNGVPIGFTEELPAMQGLHTRNLYRDHQTVS